jgi:Ca2+-binding RTX toxin-like protein
MLTVTVNETIPGFFEVLGDGSANSISISVTMASDSFTLDGNTYTDVQYITVHGFEGSDTINVISTDGPGDIGAGLSGGDDDDVIGLNFAGGVWAGNGNDIISLDDSFRGEAYGQDGDDQIYITGDCFDAEIRGGDGDDLIDCMYNALPVFVRGDEGNDTLYGSAYDDQLWGDGGQDLIIGGEGDDEIDSGTGYDDQIDGGDGWDILYNNGSEIAVAGIEEAF